MRVVIGGYGQGKLEFVLGGLDVSEYGVWDGELPGEGEVWGDGENIRDYIHIDDACKMIYALCKNKTLEDIYNISTGIGTSQNQIIAYVSHTLGPLSVIYKSKRLVDVRASILDNSRIRKIYIEPLTPIREGIVTYIEYLKTL